MKANYNKPNKDWADIVFVAFMAILGLAFVTGAITTAGPTVLAEGGKLLKSVQVAEQPQSQLHLPEEDRITAEQGNANQNANVATPTCVPECDEPAATSSSVITPGQRLDPTQAAENIWREDDPQLCLPPGTTYKR